MKLLITITTILVLIGCAIKQPINLISGHVVNLIDTVDIEKDYGYISFLCFWNDDNLYATVSKRRLKRDGYFEFDIKNCPNPALLLNPHGPIFHIQFTHTHITAVYDMGGKKK